MMKGEGGEENMVEGLALIDKSAKQGNKKAVALLQKTAKKLFGEGKILEAANLGHPKAGGIMSYNYAFGKGGFEIDMRKAYSFAKAAEPGGKLGQLMLGRCYEKGYRVAIDYAKALTWYGRCEDVYSEASNIMGYIYDKGGHNVVVNLTKAVDFYRKAADKESACGQSNLGYMYYKGEGVIQSFAEARKFFKMSAN